MPDSKINRLRARLRDLERQKEDAELYKLRCPDCGRWPWQMRTIKTLDGDCAGCIELRRTYPDPYGGQPVPVFVLDPNGVLDRSSEK